MMYNEFIEKTNFPEDFITFSDYAEKIEPIYMNLKSYAIDKNIFCKIFTDVFEGALFKPLYEMFSINRAMFESWVQDKEDTRIEHFYNIAKIDAIRLASKQVELLDSFSA